MDSEVTDHHDNGLHEHFPLDSSADLHQPNQFFAMNSSDPAPTDRFNGHLYHHLPLPHPLSPKQADLSAEIERFKADNQVLVDEIASLRDAHAAMEHTQALLQRELLGSSDRVEALSADIASLEVEKRKQEDLAACTVQEALALHAEKMDLQAENGTTASQTKSLDAMFAETKEKSSLLARDVDEKQAAMAAIQTHVHMICFEVEKLQLEKEEYSKEVSFLEASKGTIDTQINRLRLEEKALSNEVDQFVVTKALAERNVSNAQACIATLSEQVSTLTESDKGMQNKLCEAKERLRHLEEQDKSMALRERDMETCIVDLERTMHTLKANFDNAEQAVEQEKQVSSRALKMTHTSAAASERDLHILEAPTDIKQQYAQALQSQVSDLHEEKEALAHLIEALRAELRQAQEEAEVRKIQEKAEAEESIQLRKDTKRLEGTLNEAEERAHLSESKEVELRCKLQELIILAKKKPRLAGFATPLIISGGTVVALGLLVYFLRSSSNSKSK